MIGRPRRWTTPSVAATGKQAGTVSPYKGEILADWPVYFKPPVFGKGHHLPNS
jgi:hypothetical protein